MSTSLWQRLSRNSLSVIGLVLVIVIVLLAVTAPLLPLPDPNLTEPVARLQHAFSPGHWLGTDELGRDILSRLLWGARVSLAVGVVATAVAAIFGTLIGLLAGFYGGRLDNILMRGIDMLMAFPYMLLALAIVAALGPGLLNALLAIAIVNIPFFARSVRGATVSLARREFIDAARLCGSSNSSILFSELFPNVLPVVVITISTTIGWMILETAGLSFLGLGAQPPQADLGSMLGEGRKVLFTAPHVSTIPGLLILLLVIGLNLLGDGIRDALDPRLRSGALQQPAPATAVELKPELTPAKAALNDNDDNSILNITGLHTRFYANRQEYKAVNALDLTLKPGECLGIVGESGSGKSVSALSILGLVATPPGKIVGGAVVYREHDLLRCRLDELQQLRGARIAYIFQDPLNTLNPLFPVGEQIAEAIRAHQDISRQQAQQRAIELMQQVRIPDAAERAGSYPHQLSGGQRQRISIAMALANQPDIIIADEPTTALDVTIQAEVLRILDELRRQHGVAVIFISHDLGVIAQLCDRVMVMYAGQVVETAPVTELLQSPQHPYTEKLLQCVPVLGQPERSLDAIKGLPPALNRLPPGCFFADRCERVMPQCREQPVNLLPLTAQRASRCLLAGEL
jgi:peptide/nickel transport system permease protein